MKWRNAAWPGVGVLAGAGGWLLFGGGQTWTVDHGLPGVVLLVTAGWVALWIGTSGSQRASGVWTAWTGLALSVAGLAYFALHWRGLLTGGSEGQARWVMVNLMLLLLGWAVLLQVWAGHWSGRAAADPAIRPWLGHEHPRQAAESGRMALTFGLICLALLLGLLPEARLGWMRPFLLAHLLLFVLMWSWLVEYGLTLWLYWCHRRERALMGPPA